MWTFTLPTTIQFGTASTKSLRGLVNQYGCRRIIVTGSHLIGMEHVQRLLSLLADATVFSDVSPNPTVGQVDALAKIIREARGDVIVAIGGGSPLDCAKAASVLAATSCQSIQPFHTGGVTLPLDHLPVIAVPTTAGTGSEVTPIAVLDDPELDVKAPIVSPALYPAHAVIDPELTLSLPQYSTAATGMDALSHAIEGFWSKGHQPICDSFAVEAAQRIFRNLETVLKHPNDLDARSEMAYAALLAGMAFQLPKNAMVHACSFPLSTRFHLAHGAACAFTMEFAIRFNALALGDRFTHFVSACGFASVEAMAHRVTELKLLGGLPVTLADAGIPDAAIPTLVKESFHPIINNNPKMVTKEDLESMYTGLARAVRDMN